MTMSFEESLLAIYKEIIPNAEEFSSYNEDSKKIQNFILEKMQQHDPIFKTSFNGFSYTETCMDYLKLEVADEFELYIKLKMVFPITPVEDISCSGLIMLLTFEDTSHLFIKNQHLSRQILQDWLRSIFLNVIGEDGIRLHINGRNYEIKYPENGRGYGVVHTIIAQEIDANREISFDFIPAFQFESVKWPLKKIPLNRNSNSSWFAVPFSGRLPKNKNHSNEYAFMACDTQCQYLKKNFIYSLRLINTIRDVKKLELLTNYMVKSICLEELKLRPTDFCEQPLGFIIIELFEALIYALRHNNLPFCFDKRFKYLNRLRRELSFAYPIQLNLILKNLQSYQQKNRVNYADIAAFSFARGKCGPQISPN